MSHTSDSRNLVAKKVAQAGWPLVSIFKDVCRFGYHQALRYKFFKDWTITPTPEWFDHEFDLAFFHDWRKPHFFERGVYIQELLSPSMRVLDLCCGDGSVTALFIAARAQEAVGVDFDPNAIRRAQQKFGKIPNVTFKKGDIRALEEKAGSFDLVSWDAAIEHFTPDEMTRIIASIKRCLKPGGILAGSSIAKSDKVLHHDHEHEFVGTADMQEFLGQHFKQVHVWKREHGDRVNLYFRCSDAAVTLDGRSPQSFTH